uniref:Uncharacterized protein n=1 Tax=Macaca fascicularis TaxID=9541 RepID=A0A7N9D177_MACFA
MGGCRSRGLPLRKVAEAPREFESGACELSVLGDLEHPLQLLAQVLSPSLPRAASRSEWGVCQACARACWNLRWTVSSACGPSSRLRLSFHTSPQAEGASSSLSQPREGLPQCSGWLKGSSRATRVDTKAEEEPRVRAASMLSPLNTIQILFLSASWATVYQFSSVNV